MVTTPAASTPTTPSPKVWLITGCSSGLGRELAIAALARGDHVIATARNAAKIDDLKQCGAQTIVVDVTSPDEVVHKSITDTIDLYGRIDILVNNAGYGVVGGTDECSAEEIFDNFNTNVFGIFKVLRVVLPFMRAQQSGVIANIGSLAGRQSYPGLGVYSATKFAVVGLTEALRGEVAHLGIEATCIDLGLFRTSLDSNSVMAKKTVPESGPAVEFMKKTLGGGQQHGGDPAKAARVIVDALTKSGSCAGQRSLPVRLAVGSDTFQFISGVLERDQKELQEWTHLVSATDFDDVTK